MRTDLLWPLLALLLACDTPDPEGDGPWSPIPPPTGARPGTRCWVYARLYGKGAWGGPWCESPRPVQPVACVEPTP